MLSHILQLRYKAKTFNEIATRVSCKVANNTEENEKFYDLINNKRFIPAGNTLLAGIDEIRPNCAILPSIHQNNFDELIKRAKILWEDRIGIGFDLSESDNPINILKQLSKVNANIKLEHRPQRGNMAVLNSSHPMIKEFIGIKSKIDNLYNFNISVGFDSDRDLKEELIDEISKNAWMNGDPGILFLDRIQLKDIGTLGKIKTLVPCGEQGMYDNEVCTLGSMNLNSDNFWINNNFNEKLFINSVKLSVRFLDNVIDKMQINDILLSEQIINTRRIGLGILGYSDILNRLHIKYGSRESLQLIDYIGSLYKYAAHESSKELAIEKGVCKIFKDSIHKKRNITVTCIAPSGGITLLTSNKGFGIEPFFSEVNSLSFEDHIITQSYWQKYVDNCISKTINLSYESTQSDIKNIWLYARDNNLKSITIYRDKCMMSQPINCVSGKCDI